MKTADRTVLVIGLCPSVYNDSKNAWKVRRQKVPAHTPPPISLQHTLEPKAGAASQPYNVQWLGLPLQVILARTIQWPNITTTYLCTLCAITTNIALRPIRLPFAAGHPNSIAARRPGPSIQGIIAPWSMPSLVIIMNTLLHQRYHLFPNMCVPRNLCFTKTCA
jgi:hypothetical protein